MMMIMIMVIIMMMMSFPKAAVQNGREDAAFLVALQNGLFEAGLAKQRRCRQG